jgi:poly-gamma-glutamate synthesis protein (capsule biosynthesis protein)
VSGLLNTGDIVFGNLENMLGIPLTGTSRFEDRYLIGNPECVEELGSAGFNVLNLANNHALQHGRETLEATVSRLDERGIRHVGVRGQNTAIFDVRGMRIGIAGYCSDPQYEKGSGHLDLIDLEHIAAKIESFRSVGVDVIVLSMHWGDEFIDRPSAEQVRIGRSVIDLGAHLVLGHHSHVLQGVERYGNGTIVYSLGNFVSDMKWNQEFLRTIILRCDIHRHRRVDIDFIPVAIRPDYRPVPADPDEARVIRAAVEERTSAFKDIGLGRGVTTQEPYRARVARLAKRNRYQMYLHFVRNIRRYPKGTAYEILKFFLGKKIARLPWIGAVGSTS